MKRKSLFVAIFAMLIFALTNNSFNYKSGDRLKAIQFDQQNLEATETQYSIYDFSHIAKVIKEVLF